MTGQTDATKTVRDLIRGAERASLATLMADGSGPYVSLVLFASDARGAPILLLSRLAEHSKNIAGDPRVALLIDGTAGLADPLTGARVTLQGRIEPADDAEARSRYLARHPSAEGYASFGDFGFWRVAVARAHLVAGFGRIVGIDGKTLAAAFAEKRVQPGRSKR